MVPSGETDVGTLCNIRLQQHLLFILVWHVNVDIDICLDLLLRSAESMHVLLFTIYPNPNFTLKHVKRTSTLFCLFPTNEVYECKQFLPLRRYLWLKRKKKRYSPKLRPVLFVGVVSEIILLVLTVRPPNLPSLLLLPVTAAIALLWLRSRGHDSGTGSGSQYCRYLCQDVSPRSDSTTLQVEEKEEEEEEEEEEKEEEVVLQPFQVT